MIPAHSGGLLAAEVVKAVREGDIDAVRSWLAAGGDEFVNEPALYEYRRPLDRRLCRTIEKLVCHAIHGDSANSTAMVEVLLQAGARPELDFLMSAISTKNVNAALQLPKREMPTSTRTSHPPTPPREQARRKPAAPAHDSPPRRWIEFAHQKKPTAQRCAVSA